MESFSEKTTEWMGLWEHGGVYTSPSYNLKNLCEYKGNVRFVLKNNPKYIEGTNRPKYLLAITSTKTALHDLQVENEDEDDEVEYVVCVSDVKRIMKEEVYDVESGVCYADAALAHGMYSLEPYSFYATRVEE